MAVATVASHPVAALRAHVISIPRCNLATSGTRRCWRRIVVVFFFLASVPLVSASNKKPLFEYDDHYVMLNDFGRNEFYRQSLKEALPKQCSSQQGCNVLDVGAGSGLLSIQAAMLGAKNVIAIEANPALAALANQTIERNQHRFPNSNVTVLANLSSKITVDHFPHATKADILVTETFGTMLLGEGAINFIPDARERLLKEGGLIVPAGGCQYVTLIESPDIAAVSTPTEAFRLNLSKIELLQDTLYWKATMGATTASMLPVTERLCVLEVDLYKHNRESVPENRTFRVQATRSGIVHAAMFDWDVWADHSRSRLLSTSPGARNFAGDVAWGWLLQLQEAAGADWAPEAQKKRLEVAAGDVIEILVDYIAGGISLHLRARKASSSVADGEMPQPQRGSKLRVQGTSRADTLEANEFYLPVAGDDERQTFYRKALETAVQSRRSQSEGAQLTVLDCSANVGIPAVLAAVDHGLHAVTLARSNGMAEAVRQVAADNLVGDLVEAYAAEPREFIEALMPLEKKADIAILEPPGTPAHGLSPFALLPVVQKRLLTPGGAIVPSHACLEVGLIESDELSHIFAIPDGRWEDINLTVWNEEAYRQRVLERFVPYTKWLGKQSTVERRWLAEPRCLFEVDFNVYNTVSQEEPELSMTHNLAVAHSGRVHAIVGTWRISSPGNLSLGAESSYLGRSLTWPHYIQAVASPATSPGLLAPLEVTEGANLQLVMEVKQGSGKQTAAAGPEFRFKVVQPSTAGSSGGHPGFEL